MLTDPSSATRYKILIAEDEAALAKVIKATLEHSGFVVSCAPDGVAAESMIAAEVFDLVISDINMPKKNGIELLKFTIHKGGPPVILMTGFSDLSETNDILKMGAKGIFGKPFKRADLLALVNSVLASDKK